MRSAFQLVATGVDALVRPFATAPPAWLLTAAALFVAVVTLLAFRRFSDQARLRTTKNRIKAHILELWLFRDDVGIVLRAQARLLGLNARYLALTLKPMAVLLVPVLLLLGALDPWYALRPLRPGDTAIVSVRLGDAAAAGDARLVPEGAVAVETPALRIPAAGEIDWRIRALEPGVHRVAVEIGGQRLTKEVVAAASGRARVNPSRTDSELWQALTAPGEPALPAGAGIQRIEVHYPAASIEVLGWETHWLVYFFLATVVFVFLLRKPLRVDV